MSDKHTSTAYWHSVNVDKNMFRRHRLQFGRAGLTNYHYPGGATDGFSPFALFKTPSLEFIALEFLDSPTISERTACEE